MDVYDADHMIAVDKFYDEIKKYGSFETEIKVMGFLMDTGDIL